MPARFSYHKWKIFQMTYLTENLKISFNIYDGYYNMIIICIVESHSHDIFY